MSNDFLRQLMEQMIVFGILGVILYIYVAVCLSTIARKTGTPSSWMAWVPIANLVLMCRIAKKPGTWVLLMLIPFVNIVIYLMLWMAIARVRGKSPGLSFLFLLPPVGFLIVPAVYASGEAAATSVSGASAAGPDRPSAQSAPPVCPACGRSECVGDEFCGYTGQRIVDMKPAAPSGVPTAHAAPQGGPLVKVLAVLVLVAGLGSTAFGLYSRVFSRSRASNGPTSSTSASSGGGGSRPIRRGAGTMSLFPVDTAAAPARPVSVVSQNLKNGDGSLKVAAKWLPPGVNGARLKRQSASAITSAEYKNNPQDSPVDVHVIEMPPPDASERGGNAGTVARWVSESTGAAPTGVSVKAPDGQQFGGEVVKTPQITVYALNNPEGNAVVVIYAADPAARATADRLAGNVGNGQGLNDYPQTAGTVGLIPDTLAGGLQLESSNAMDTAGMLSTDELSNVVGNTPEARQWVEKTKSYMPGTVTSATYRDPNRREWNVLVGDFGNTGRSWYTWMALKLVIGLSGMQSTDAGYISSDANSRLLLQRKSRYIYLMRAPVDIGPERLSQTASGFAF